VLQAAETAVREVVGKSRWISCSPGPQRDQRAREGVDAADPRPLQDGINITTVNLQGAQAPEQVQAAFEDVVRAGQDRERFKNEAQAYANDVVPKARGIAPASSRKPTATARAW